LIINRILAHLSILNFLSPPVPGPDRFRFVLPAQVLPLRINSGGMNLRPHVDAPLPSDFPKQFSLHSPQHPTPATWWQDFQSPELNRLQAAGLQENPGLQIAWARMRRNRAAAALVPEFSAGATGATLRSKNADGGDSTLAEERPKSRKCNYSQGE